MKKVSCYLRVSTMNQSVESQKLELEKYCERQDWKIINFYEDHAISGTKSSRPALNKMLDDCRNGKAGEIIVTYKIDRLARSTADLLRILSELNNSDVGFVSMTQAIDTSTSYGKMVMVFLGAIAEFERDTIVERVKSGLERARSEGKTLGRPRVAVNVPEAIRLRDEGLGYKQIAKALGIPRTTLYRTLKAIPKRSTQKAA
jgi:DNA invertase Pin-like site-specific DNA recombinase